MCQYIEVIALFPFDEFQKKGARYCRAAKVVRRETGALMRKTMDAICQLVLGLIAASGFSSQVLATDYYAGKTIDVIVGGAPSGGIDLYARGVARHFGNHIPGSPNFVVKNIPGASGIRAMQQVYSVMPSNGQTIAAITPGAIVAPLIDEKADRSVDPAKLIYLGTTNAGVGICATMDTSTTKTFEDALVRKTIMGAQGPGAVSYDFAYLVQNVTGAKFNIVTGYNGSTHFLLAMERGEIDGICGWNWSSAKSQKADWIRDKKINIILQTGVEEDEELARMGVPPIWKYASDAESRKVAQFILAQKGFERPLVVGPQTPQNLVNILRSAFDSTMKDPQFQADMEKGGLDIAPASGGHVQKLVEAFYATPKEIIAKGRAAIRP
jgi:hypothetical protein